MPEKFKKILVIAAVAFVVMVIVNKVEALRKFVVGA
jgi:hypothetical protein